MRLFFTIQYYFLVLTGFSQALFTNESSLITNTGVVLSIEGSAMNSGILVNEGTMRLNGDWANNGDYRSVSGTFDLIGNDLNMDAGPSSYYHIGIDGNVNLLSDLRVTGTFELNSGVLNTSEDAVLSLGEEVIATVNNEAYVNGILYSSQQGDVTFPIGTSTEYLPVKLFGIISSEPVGVKAIGSPLHVEVSDQLDAISPNRHWQILDNGDFSISAIELPVVNEDFIENDNELTIGFTDDLANPVIPFGSSELNGSLSSGTLTSRTPVLPGYYVIADASSDGPPIKVVNVVTPLQDGKHDFLRIENIEFYENNRVEIFDRNGNKVFEMDGYNNADRVFTGNANRGAVKGALTTGNYFYTVQAGEIKEAGFIYIKN